MTRSFKHRRSVICAFAAGTVLASGAGASPASAATGCSAAHRTVIKSAPEMLVFSPPGAENGYVCVRSTGKVRRLWFGDGIYTVGDVLRIRGSYIAYILEVPPSCKAECPDGFSRSYRTAVMDVRTGKRRILGTNIPTFVRLRPSGTFAYLETPATPGPAGTYVSRLYVWDTAGRRLLDSGDIRFSSLGLTDTSVRWTNGTTPRSQPIG